MVSASKFETQKRTRCIYIHDNDWLLSFWMDSQVPPKAYLIKRFPLRGSSLCTNNTSNYCLQQKKDSLQTCIEEGAVPSVNWLKVTPLTEELLTFFKHSCKFFKMTWFSFFKKNSITSCRSVSSSMSLVGWLSRILTKLSVIQEEIQLTFSSIVDYFSETIAY